MPRQEVKNKTQKRVNRNHRIQHKSSKSSENTNYKRPIFKNCHGLNKVPWGTTQDRTERKQVAAITKQEPATNRRRKRWQSSVYRSVGRSYGLAFLSHVTASFAYWASLRDYLRQKLSRVRNRSSFLKGYRSCAVALWLGSSWGFLG